MADREKMEFGVFGYIFLAEEPDQLVSETVQQVELQGYAEKIGLQIDDYFVEEGVSMKLPFRRRRDGGKLFQLCEPSDAIITLRTEWVLSSATEGGRLLRVLRKKQISLYCVDLGINISLDVGERKNSRTECGGVVHQLLNSLAICESSKHGDAIRASKKNRKRAGKYLGGPIPFGWKVNEEGEFIQHKDQQKTIQVILELRENRLSYRNIAEKLQCEFNVQLSHAGVRRVLENDIKRKAAEQVRKKRAKKSQG